MNRILILLLGATILVGIYTGLTGRSSEAATEETKNIKVEKVKKATFAGGCFWCMQPPFDDLRGVISTAVGYTGGPEKNPTYKEVAYGRTGHAEAIEIVYDPSKVSYAELLDVFWRNINPTQRDGQFVDKGSQYRSAIFYHNENTKALSQNFKRRLGEIRPF